MRNPLLLVLALVACGVAVSWTNAAGPEEKLLPMLKALAELQVKFGDDHPQVRVLKAQIDVARELYEIPENASATAKKKPRGATGPQFPSANDSRSAQNEVRQAGAVAGPSGIDLTEPLADGRFMLSSNATDIVLLDRMTGKSWLLRTGEKSNSPKWVTIQRPE